MIWQTVSASHRIDPFEKSDYGRSPESEPDKTLVVLHKIPDTEAGRKLRMDGLREGMVLREINGVPLAAVKKRGARTHLLTGIDGEPHPAKQVRHAPCPPPARHPA